MRFVAITKYAALFFLILVVALIAASIRSARIPSDSDVVKQFDGDRSVLLELRDKLAHEPPSIVGIAQDEVMLNDNSNWVPPEKAGFSESHFLEYRTLMEKADIKEIWYDEGVLNFGIAGFGFAGIGWRLSFAYTKTAPPSLIPSLDALPRNIDRDPTVEYRALGNDWYMRIVY